MRPQHTWQPATTNFRITTSTMRRHLLRHIQRNIRMTTGHCQISMMTMMFHMNRRKDPTRIPGQGRNVRIQLQAIPASWQPISACHGTRIRTLSSEKLTSSSDDHTAHIVRQLANLILEGLAEQNDTTSNASSGDRREKEREKARGDEAST